MGGRDARIWSKFRAIGDATGYRRQPVTRLQCLYVLIFWPSVCAIAAYLLADFADLHWLTARLLQWLGAGKADSPGVLLAAPGVSGLIVGLIVAVVICAKLRIGERAERREPERSGRREGSKIHYEP
jgi:hypothetical protein